MMTANLISKNDAEEYIYGVQILLEKIISYATILLLALILNRLLEIILFVVSFSLIRKYSGGIHCKRFETCLIASVAVSISGVFIFPPVENRILLYQGGGDNVNNNCYSCWRYQQPQYRLEQLRI